MQTEAPEVFDMSKEPQETLDLTASERKSQATTTDAVASSPGVWSKKERASCALYREAARLTPNGTPIATSKRTTSKMASYTDKPVAGLYEDT